MRIMVVGGGGREHAIIKYLSKSPKADKIYALPGNGGIAELAECVNIKAEDLDGIVKFAVNNKIDFAVVAPDDPLVMGAVDKLEAAGIKCFGPRANAAIIEGSKIFAKNLMRKYKIPTANFEVFSDLDKAIEYVNNHALPLVIKADGLAKGKGVVVAETLQEAEDALISCMRDKKFGSSGEKVLIEECLTGPEVSVLAFTDGHTLVPMVSSMDHTRAYDNNQGANTGGMGVIAPNPHYDFNMAARCEREIFMPTINAMNKEGRKFKGCLYFGLMLTPQGPKVIEYNCRFGDPETQAVLPLLSDECDLLEIMLAVSEERLSSVRVLFKWDCASCCVVMASREYPDSCKTGFEINIDAAKIHELNNVNIFHAGTKLNQDGKLLTSGGRVLAVTAVAKSKSISQEGVGDALAQARSDAYNAIKYISFDGARYRSDIGLH
ncbi:MAG: phosphoribosylamine--glycine ligase [Synergistaceae bacterium]|nr:phosphoribosylamine--glycine ligase [Synergistaceae bacterium]